MSSNTRLILASLLSHNRTIDAITFVKPALDPRMTPYPEHPKWFLHRIFEEHRKLCATFASIGPQERKAMMLTVDNIEVGEPLLPLLNQVDMCKFLIPTSMLASTSVVEAVTTSPILPLLRVLGVSSTLRLLSALLSEDRVLLISSSPTRLAQCARSALSILAQGMLNWQHLFIPVLPPHLFQYLGAPVPYLIGMMASLVPRLDQAQNEGLGEMVIINLDNNLMETRGMNPADVARKVPDLFQKALSEQGMPASSMSASEMLAQDLTDLLKVDKRVLYGESALTNVSETAAKATKAVKSGISKLARKGKNFFNNRMNGIASEATSGTDDEGTDVGASGTSTEEPAAILENAMTPDFIFIQGSQNEPAEEEARIAFTSFFLSMFGNMRWYLSANPGQLPALDRKRYLQQKRAMNEGENTPIWPLLENFVQTQMLEEFAKSRVEEVRLRLPVTADSPLFTQCSNYHRVHNVDFGVVNVRRVARQVAQNNPSRMIVQTSARRTAMMLTSNRTFEGDYNKAVAQLVEECRECTSVLFDVMSVIWVRMRDSKGLHWKHGFQSLQILRNLLYHGPLAAIAEATDGLDKIRAMKFFNDNMRSQICTQIRQVATQVYNLLVDRAKLFNIRRLCANKRRILRKPDQGRFMKDTRLRITVPFSKIHPLLNPKSSARVAPATQVPPSVGAGTTPSAQFGAQQDFFGLTSPPVPAAAAQMSVDPTQDMIGRFRDTSISAPAATPSYDPFGLAQHTGQQQAPTAPAPVQTHAPMSYATPAHPPQQNPFAAPPQQPPPPQQQQPSPYYQQQPQNAPPPSQPNPAQYPGYQASRPAVAGYPGGAQPPHAGIPHQQLPPQTYYYQQQQQPPPAGYPHPHQQHPPAAYPPQQQYQYSQPPPAAGQPPKPNVSQFDPFS